MAGMTAQQVSDRLAECHPEATVCVMVQSTPDKIVVARVRGVVGGQLLARKGGGWLFDMEADGKWLLLHTAGEIEYTVAELRLLLAGRDMRIASSNGADTALCGIPVHVAFGSLVVTADGLHFDDEQGGERCALIY